MPLRFTVAPENGSALVVAYLKSAAGKRLPRGLVVNHEEMLVTSPHAVYELRDLSQIINGGGLETAFNFGIRYFIELCGQVVAASEVLVDEAGLPTRSAFFGYGPGLQITLRSLADLQINDQVSRRSYEVQLLRNRSLFEAIWLKSDDGNNDLICPFGVGKSAGEQVFAGLQAGSLYAPGDFLDVIRPQFQKLLTRAQQQ